MGLSRITDQCVCVVQQLLVGPRPITKRGPSPPHRASNGPIIRTRQFKSHHMNDYARMKVLLKSQVLQTLAFDPNAVGGEGSQGIETLPDTNWFVRNAALQQSDDVKQVSVLKFCSVL